MTRPVIGIDASRSVGRVRTGTENYSAEIIRGLVRSDAGVDWRLYFNEPGDLFDGQQPANVDIRDLPARRLWTHLRLSRELAQHRVTGLFVPSHVVPLYHPPTVVTLHDLGYLHHPELHPANQRRMLDMTSRWSAKVARHIIVPSQQTATDLQTFYRVPESKITVIHHGIDTRMSPTPSAVDETLRERYGLTRPFVLAVGTVHPRKNLGVLARAMTRVVNDQDVDLVIAGRPGWMYDDVVAKLQAAGLGDRLKLLSYVPHDDLPALYRAAEIFAQPSRFEGFGMPVIEAMASGTPVIAARGSSLDEIGGDAALSFDGDDHEELHDQIASLLSNGVERERRIQRGLAWSSGFTWEHAAEKTRIVLEDNLVK